MFDRALETLGPEPLRDHQWRRFRAMAVELLSSNPFVRRKWRAAGVNALDDLCTWDDFQRLPFTRKSEFVDDQAEHPPFGTNLTFPLERYVRVHQTSGTSGAPIRWLDTQESWEWWARCWGFVLRGAGVGPADRVFFPFSFGLFIGFWAGFEGARALGALAIPGGGQDSATRLAWIETLGATVLVCTPSYALHLLEIARGRSIDPAKLPVRATVHAGEPGAGIPAVRARIEEGWGARAFDHAGMTEMGAYGYECAEQAGLHVNESEFIAEVVDPVTGRPARDGELVLTNLGRVGSPIARYRTGDHVRLAEAPCPCGRTFQRLEGGILGRLTTCSSCAASTYFRPPSKGSCGGSPRSKSSRSRSSGPASSRKSASWWSWRIPRAPRGCRRPYGRASGSGWKSPWCPCAACPATSSRRAASYGSSVGGPLLDTIFCAT